ncbi:tyrosine-type recombinase/integrase [sulfur-oxidizing endosymbiont of Gigantopelta aegis]|uniref:tyrosine-type recombinase/integrase n=1 Tax=sulfur-oxidizing endosymbiont of Gigantopelta aegis TaxID=2794934 RepID=UPI0018DE6499|nr:site-specific integrase [sulfur-oxidizing endosymbiont of Gigantopelta aegis]
MALKQQSPLPIIDNLNYIGNPFKQKVFDAKVFTGNTIPGADTDFEYALKFLFSYNGSTATFNSYRREIERLLQWAWRIEHISILKLRREHIEDFIRFCYKPPISWIGTKNTPRFKTIQNQRIANDQWRPFVVKISKIEHSHGKVPDQKNFFLSQSSIKATFTALSSFFEYLIQESLSESNPVALIKQKSKFIQKDQLKPIVRRISTLQWDYVIETAELMAKENPPEHERTLFIMNCLFAMYLRISELVEDERSTPIMGDFRKDRDNNWWFDVTGKGNKNRSITVCDDMLNALKRYRRYLGYTALPALNEQHPLIIKSKGQGGITSTRHIRRIVQHTFDTAYERMKADGLQDDADDLQVATVHWLRHTGISEDVKFRPREHVRDDAGHASMATTDRYIESDLRERHNSGKQKRIKDIL